jgi:hypothetical protein
VKVDPGGYWVSWNDEADLSEYELWVNGRLIDENHLPPPIGDSP